MSEYRELIHMIEGSYGWPWNKKSFSFLWVLTNKGTFTIDLNDEVKEKIINKPQDITFVENGIKKDWNDIKMSVIFDYAKLLS